MRRQTFTAMALLIIVSVASAGDRANAQRPAAHEDPGAVQAVQQAFEAYRQAILNGKGEAAARLVTQGTLAYYRRLQEAALRGKEADVRRLPILDKLAVLRMRHQVPLESLRAMTPARLLAYGVEQGWIGKEEVRQTRLGTVTITGNEARSVMVKNGQPTPLKFRFAKEAKEWRFDLTAMFAAAGAAFKTLVAESGTSEDDFLLQILELVSGKKPAASIWQPLIRE